VRQERLVRDLVRHLPTGIVLDLADPGYGHPDGPAIVAALREQQAKKRSPGRHVLVCERHDSDLFLQSRSGRFTGTRLFGIHFDGAQSHEVAAAVMSDEHKRIVDYLARAASDVGLRSEREVTLSSRTRPDAVIYGQEDIGIEVQRSALTRQAAVSRTRKAMEGGLATSLWFTDWDIRHKTSWEFRVPTIRINARTWSEMPPRRGATVTTGLRVVRAVKCAFDSRCPKHSRGGVPCGKWFAAHDPWLGLTADDVATMAPGGQLMPMRFRGKDVLLMSPRSLSLYEELEGVRPELIFAPAAERGRPNPSRIADRIECVAPLSLRGPQLELIFPGAVTCFRCGEQGAGSGGILCGSCTAEIQAKMSAAP
jgi:hypothetical protein